MRIPDEWSFTHQDVAGNFNSHVREQLPWYDIVTDAIAQIARHFIGTDGLVYDIGASTGNVGLAIKDTLEARNASLIAIESSAAMVNRYEGPGELLHARAESIEYVPFDLAICNLVLTFLRPEVARKLVQTLLSTVRPDGAIILVERMLPTDPYLGIVTSRLTIAAKVKAGADPSEILAKELSLGGVQRPLSTAHVQSLGAHEWFRFGDFAGWILLGGRDDRHHCT